MDGTSTEVSVGTHRISVTVFGSGSPAVVIEPAFGGNAQSWRAVAETIGEQTTVVTYDRAPYGASSRAADHRTPAEIAADLHGVLEAAAIRRPVVLVGHSAGGVCVRAFAGLSPAGPAVLVDMSDDGGNTWQTGPFAVPGQVTTITALPGGTGGFAAASQLSSASGAADAVVWTSPGGASWTRSPVSSLAGGGSHDITALIRSGSDVTGIETFRTQATQEFIILPLTAR
jgi:pimeloyl-ACP methyl ester carboxylesterase